MGVFLNTAGKIYSAASAQTTSDQQILVPDPVFTSALNSTPAVFSVPYLSFLATKSATQNLNTGVMAV